MHATRGGASTPESEFQATLHWFGDSSSQVSAHVVIAVDGTLAMVVPDDLVAWHARSYNAEWLGAELVQPHIGDAISDAQYQSLAWWLKRMAARYGFPLDAAHLPEHRDIPDGIKEGKTDVGLPFSVARLLEVNL